MKQLTHIQQNHDTLAVTNMIVTCNTLMSTLDIENIVVLYDHQMV